MNGTVQSTGASPRRSPAAPDRGDGCTIRWRRRACGGIVARRPVKVAVLAQAAKTARIAWAMLVSGETYRKPAMRPAAWPDG